MESHPDFLNWLSGGNAVVVLVLVRLSPLCTPHNIQGEEDGKRTIDSEQYTHNLAQTS